jgi:hypothetical protein
VSLRHLAVLAVALLTVPPRAAFAWDDFGHMVITRIAWGQLTPRARERVTALLLEAPSDAGLAQLRPPAADSARDLMFAAYASVWPDLIRRRDPVERHAYHHAPWHYINWFWSAGPDGSAVAVAGLEPEPENIVVELERQSRLLADTTASRADRAVALAWVLHLVGDVHQPLHTSGRVTPQEPAGDKGGNTFDLGGSMTLHWYWDRVLSARYPRNPGEGETEYVARVASMVQARTPADSVTARVAERDFERWARESLRTAEVDVYCCGVERGQAAPLSYLAHADAVSEPAIALAGYRLAALLNRLIGQ